jgi:hypothetical protein
VFAGKSVKHEWKSQLCGAGWFLCVGSQLVREVVWVAYVRGNEDLFARNDLIVM